MPKSSLSSQNPYPRGIRPEASPMTGGIESYGVRRLDTAIANCSRLLLDRAPAELAVPEALTGLLQGLDAVHAMLFQIRSYHAEDYRGQWLTCSSAEDCTCCGDIRDWDYLQLLDARMRTEMEAGRSGRIRTNQLSLEFKQVMADRGVMALLVLPLTVMGKWWGCLCIEEPHYDCAEIPACRSDLQTLAALFSIHYERRQAAAGFQERDKLSGALEMAGTVCHKLNQPMQVILGYASMVTSGDIRDPDQIGEIVQLIEDETRQMGIITKNLMGITKHHRAG